MGKLVDSLLEGSSGKVGRIVIANLEGTDILKKRPKPRKKGPSLKQRLIESRMKTATKFVHGYVELAKKHFGTRRKMVSRYNFAMQNVLNAMHIDVDAGTITTDFSSIMTTEGQLPPIFALTLTSPAIRKLKITWSDNSGSEMQRQTDQLQLVISTDALLTRLFTNEAARSAETLEVTLPLELVAKPIHIWATFLAIDELAVSDSVYLGTITVPDE